MQNFGLNKVGNFSLVTGRLLNTQSELLQEAFNVIESWDFPTTERH